MPYKPKKPCKYRGCSKLTDDKYCEEHKGLEMRVSAKDRGYDRRWRKERKVFLQARPFCIRCLKENKLVQAEVVDHIKPHRGDETLFWDKSNWQPLCKSCHDKKTMTEDRNRVYNY
ncbi:MAG: HNH endonuclease [Clostridium sp.]